MALNTVDTKSIALMAGIALVGTIFVVGTVMLSRTRETPVTSKAYSEPVSGVVFDAPADWTVGTANTNLIQLRAVRFTELQSQKSTCSQFSEAISKAIRVGLEDGPNAAGNAWQKEFPGLVETSVLTSAGGMSVLIGIDTCNPSLAKRSLTLRGQFYRNDAEIRFSREIEESSELSQNDIRELARSLVRGDATRHQIDYQLFAGLLQSIR